MIYTAIGEVPVLVGVPSGWALATEISESFKIQNIAAGTFGGRASEFCDGQNGDLGGLGTVATVD